MNDGEKTITLSETQLEKIIETAVVKAIRETKAEDQLPGNEVDERVSEPEVFDLLENTASSIMALVIVVSLIIIIAGIIEFVKSGFVYWYVMICLDLVVVVWYCISAIRALFKAKRIEVLNTIFSAIMAFSSLTVAVVSAYFAYLSIGGGAA